MKNKTISETFDCANNISDICYNHLCLKSRTNDENRYWHMHVEYVYNSVVKHFGNSIMLKL